MFYMSTKSRKYVRNTFELRAIQARKRTYAVNHTDSNSFGAILANFREDVADVAISPEVISVVVNHFLKC